MKTKTVLTASSIALMFGSTAAMAADKSKDPYIAAFENYAKETPELAGAMKAYVKDLEKAVKQEPELKFKPHSGEGH